MKYTLLIIYYNIYILSIFSENLIKPKLCIDCKYFKKDFFIDNKFGTCSFFPIEKEDDYFLVDGIRTKKTEYMFCNVARKIHDMCGEEGKFYEKKVRSNKKHKID